MSKILCIVDSYKWAQAFRADNLSKVLTKHKFTKIHFKEISKVDLNKFDVIYAMNWPLHGCLHGRLRPKHKRNYRVCVTVCSHVGRADASKLSHIFKHYDRISTANLSLRDEFYSVYKNKVYYTPFGVNLNIFSAQNKPSELSTVFGWAGNKSRPVKRVPIIERACEDNEIKLKIASGLNYEKMPSWYNSIGNLICYSQSEGTPGPVLEAAACGRNIISTPVGNVPELFSNTKIPMVNSEAELKEQISFCLKNPNVIDERGSILKSIIAKDWNWNKRALAFEKFLLK